MKYTRIGNSGIQVSAMCLGTVPFGHYVSEGDARTIVDRCWDAGINFFDTANVYARGQSETVLGRILQGRRHQAIIATKVQMRVGDGPNDRGLSRAHILEQIEISLSRLQTDYVDLYYAHWPDHQTPLDETLRAFDDLVRQGKVRYLGCSNFPAWLLCKALWISDVRNLSSFICLQPRYNLIDKGIEAELLPFCAEQGIGVVPYSPLAGGFLTGKYSQGREPPEDTRFGRRKETLKSPYWHDANFSLVNRLTDVARTHSKTPAQLALAWLINNPIVTAPIIGATRLSQLEETIEAADMTLSEEEKEACDGMRGVGPEHLQPLAPPAAQR